MRPPPTLHADADGSGWMCRLMGAEMEYVLHAEQEPADARFNRAHLYGALRAAVSSIVPTRPGQGLSSWARDRIFLSNGGSLYYESVPELPEHGLAEASTPECRGPQDLLRHLRGRDLLMTKAAALASERLGTRVTLRANGVDPSGRVYGPQESYEAEFARGPALWIWRGLAAILLVWATAAAILHQTLQVAAGVLLLVVHAVARLLAAIWQSPPPRRQSAESPAVAALRVPEQSAPDRAVTAILLALSKVLLWVLLGPPVWLASRAVHLIGWRGLRQRTNAFFATRQLYSGAGSLMPDGAVHLSEKAAAIGHEVRWSVSSSDHGFYEIGHVLKGIVRFPFGSAEGTAAIFRGTQRLQLGLADALRADIGAWLALTTTSLVLDLAEAGALEDAPRLRDVVAAAKAVSRGGPQAEVELRDGTWMTALEVQRWYAERAHAWLRAQEPAPIQAVAVADRWRSALHDLAVAPERLFGSVDWVTKAGLISQAGAGLSWSEKKKIDLRYHDLGAGPLAWLREAGHSPVLVTDEEAEHASRWPPANTPAALRGQLVRDLQDDPAARVGWETVQTGGGRHARVYDLRARMSANGTADVESTKMAPPIAEVVTTSPPETER